MSGPRLRWQLPWVLFRILRTCCYCINQIIIFQEQSASLANLYPICYICTWVQQRQVFLCTQSAVFTEGSILWVYAWAKASASWLPGVVRAFWVGTWKIVCSCCLSGQGKDMLLQADFNVFRTSWPHKGLFVISYPSPSHYLSYRVHLFKIAQLSVQRVTSQGSGAVWWSNQSNHGEFSQLAYVLAAVYIATRWYFVGLYQVFAPCQSWSQSWRDPKGSLSCCLCHSAWPTPFGVTLTHI